MCRWAPEHQWRMRKSSQSKHSTKVSWRTSRGKCTSRHSHRPTGSSCQTSACHTLAQLVRITLLSSFTASQTSAPLVSQRILAHRSLSLKTKSSFSESKLVLIALTRCSWMNSEERLLHRFQDWASAKEFLFILFASSPPSFSQQVVRCLDCPIYFVFLVVSLLQLFVLSKFGGWRKDTIQGR